jgi:hypothetical protein
MSILVLGSHPYAGWSMRRYSQLLVAAFEMNDVPFEYISPPNYLSKHFKPGGRRKFTIYVEKLIFSVFIVPIKSFGRAGVHIADSGDAYYALFSTSREILVTCHDIYAILAARNQINGVRIRRSGVVYQRIIVMGIRKAKRVIAVSEKTDNEFRRQFPNKTTIVVQNPIDPQFANLEEPELSSGLEELKAFQPYCLMLMNDTWRKSRITNLKMWASLQRSDPSLSINLLIVGEHLSEKERNYLQQFELLQKVRVIPNMEASLIPEAYKCAEFVLNIANFEGFGWPVVEANSQGRIAIHSDLELQIDTYDKLNICVESNSDFEISIDQLRLGFEESQILRKRTLEKFSLEGFAASLNALWFDLK